MKGICIGVQCVIILAALSHCSSDVTNPSSPYKDKTTLQNVINVEYISYEKWCTTGDMNIGLQVENAFNLCDVAVYGAFSYSESAKTPDLLPVKILSFVEWGARALAQSSYCDCPKILPHEQTINGKYFYIVAFAQWVSENWPNNAFVFAYGGAYRSVALAPPQMWPENNEVGIIVIAAHDLDKKYSEQYTNSYPRRRLYKSVIHELGHGLTGGESEHTAHGNVDVQCCPLAPALMYYHQECENPEPLGEFHPFCSRSSESLPFGHKEKIQRFQFVIKH